MGEHEPDWTTRIFDVAPSVKLTLVWNNREGVLAYAEVEAGSSRVTLHPESARALAAALLRELPSDLGRCAVCGCRVGS